MKFNRLSLMALGLILSSFLVGPVLSQTIKQDSSFKIKTDERSRSEDAYLKGKVQVDSGKRAKVRAKVETKDDRRMDDTVYGKTIQLNIGAGGAHFQ
jgi:hypothetical protein